MWVWVGNRGTLLMNQGTRSCHVQAASSPNHHHHGWQLKGTRAGTKGLWTAPRKHKGRLVPNPQEVAWCKDEILPVVWGKDEKKK